MSKLLSNLYVHTKEALLTKESETIQKNIELIKEVFTVILDESKSYSKSSIFYDFTHNINEIVLSMFNEGLNKEAIKLVNDIYEIYINTPKKEVLEIYHSDIFRKINSVIEDQRSYKQVNDLRIEKLLINLIRSSGLNNGYLIDNYAPTMYSTYYLSVIKNRNLNDEDKNKLISEVINNTLMYSKISAVRNDTTKQLILTKSILYLLKAMIDKKDLKKVSDSLIKINNRILRNSDSISFSKLLIHLIIYLYYLAYKEDTSLVSEKDKTLFDNFLNGSEMKRFYNSLKNYSYGMWDDYLEIKSEIKKWEIFGEYQAKWVIMEYVVKEFFLFFSIATSNFNLDKINRDNAVFTEPDIFSFLDSYLNGKKLNDGLVDSYSTFIRVFKFNRDVDHDINVLKNQLISAYKQSELNKLKGYIKNSDKFKRNIEILKESVINSLNDIPYFRLSRSCKSNLNNQKKDVFKMRINLTIDYIGYSNKTDYEYISNTIRSKFEEKILEDLSKLGVIHKKLNYSYNNKIKELLETLESIESNKEHNINTVITGIPADSHVLYMESDTDKQNLYDFLDKVNTVEKTNEFKWIGFDANELYARIEHIDINNRYISDDEIDSILKQYNDEDKYYINITNNILVPFTREEAIEYLKMKDTYIRINIKYSVSLNTLGAGFIIEIVFD